MYRGFIKKINALDGMSIGSADLRILNMRIKRDILTKATSEFQVIGIPNAASVGDVFGVYDDAGKTVYLGVINSLENGVINTDQIIGIFDDNWKYNDVLTNSIEGKIKGIIERDFANSQDTLQASIFNKFDITKTTDTINNFEYSSSRSLNFMNFLTSAYDTYWVLTNIDVKYNAVRPTITIGVPNYPTIKIGNNNTALRNFEILQEEQSTNKIKIYDSKGETLRATYYASPNGISTNSDIVGRPTKIRTQIISSDDPLADIVAANLSTQMYSHQISVDMILNNQLYNFDDFNLGQQFDIYYSGEYYNSILTGYEVRISGEGKAETVKLIFGKVRFTLENKIYEIANNSIDANSKVENIGGTIVSMETQIVQNSEQIGLRATKTEVTEAEAAAKSYSDAQLTIKAGEIQSNVTQQINGISTGGSNLEAGTNKGGEHWTCGVGGKYYIPTTQSVTWLKTNSLKIISNGVKDSTSTSDWYIALHIPPNAYRLSKILKPSTKYTLSYDVYYSGGITKLAFNIINIMNGSYQHQIGRNFEVVSSTRRIDEFGREYVHTVRRITTVDASDANWNETDPVLYFGMGGMETSGAYYVIANVMLTEGTVEKAWERSIFDTEDSIATNTTNITQNAQEIALKASQSEVNTLTGKVNTNTTNITQNANDIVLSATSLTNAINGKASQSSVDEITRAVVISSNGVDIKKNGSNTSYSHFDETGMKVFVNNNVVAEATSSQFVIEGQGGMKVQGWNLSRGSNANILNLTKG